jgi:alpha/beta hydrolase family protein
MATAVAVREDEPEIIPLEVGEEPHRIELRLRRYGGRDASKNVLLLHGANTSSRTFLEPNGGLERYLTANGWQVWLLDWRGSPCVIGRLPRDHWLGGTAIEEIRHYTVDDVARLDIPAALRKIRERIGPGARLSVLGHCVGGGSLAIAIATGALAELGVQRVVLSTLGLFYEVTWSGWIKAEDFILERILENDPSCGGVSPRRCASPDPRAWPWPWDIRYAYENFPRAWLPDGKGPGGETFRRLAFMIGEPYAAARLDPSLRDGRADPIFGPLHLGLYLHLGQMARRGFAAPLGAPDVIDRTRLAERLSAPPSPQDYLEPGPFLEVETTLLCAAANQVWHRDAADLMHEWLRGHGAPCVKRVFPGYDIQELLWGERAVQEVYPTILQAI